MLSPAISDSHKVLVFAIQNRMKKNICQIRVFIYFGRIEKYEEIADRMDEEIVTFLTQIIRSDVSKSTTERGSAMIKLVNRIESISDSCYLMAQFIKQASNNKIAFDDEMVDIMKQIFLSVEQLMDELQSALEEKDSPIDLEAARAARDNIKESIETLNVENLKAIKKGNYKYKIGIIYTDVYTEQGVLADHCYHGLKYVDEMQRAR